MIENEKNQPTERMKYESIPPIIAERIYDTMNIVARVPMIEIRISL